MTCLDSSPGLIVGDSFCTTSLIRGGTGVPVPAAEPPVLCQGTVPVMHVYIWGPLSCHALPS